MAMSKVKGQMNTNDQQSQRPGFGTVGTEHAIPQGIGGAVGNSVIDDQDPRITYGRYTSLYPGTGPVVMVDTRGETFDSAGTTTRILTKGGAAAFTFNGTSLAIMGRINFASSAVRVFIDGVPTNGRVMSWTGLDASFYTPLFPLNSTDTTINLSSMPFPTPTPGSPLEVLIGAERITYTGVSGNTLTGCTRGANGTVAQSHLWTEICYYMSSYVDLNPGFSNTLSFSQSSIIYYNPFLQPGTHKVIVVVDDSPTTGGGAGYGFWFDGFVVGSIIGAKNIYRSVNTMEVSFTTDGAGMYTIPLVTRSGVSLISILGHNLIGGPNMPIVEVCGDPDYNAEAVIRIRGNASASYSLQFVFAFIGETI